MGCIGYVVGNGLKKELLTIYAPNSIDKMITGYAYTCAESSHTNSSGSCKNCTLIDFTEEEREAVMIIFGDINRSVVLIAEDQFFFYKTFKHKFIATRKT